MKELLFVAGDNCSLSVEVLEKVDLFKSLNPEIEVSYLHAGKDEDVYSLKTGGHRFSSTPAFAALEDGNVLEIHEGKVCEVRLLKMFTGERSEKDSGEVVEDSSGKKIVFFSGSWCDYCKQMDVVIEDFAKQNSDVKILKLDVESDSHLVPENCYNQDIDSVPTFFFIENNKFVKAHSGMFSVSGLEKFVN
jgi:thiol-disulfide isomerase/thioredoxin